MHTSPRYDFFIAHAAADKPAARVLDDQLKAKGCTAFLDERCVLPGARWDRVISGALKGSAAVVALVSGDPTKPGAGHYFSDELATAIAERRASGAPIVPIYLKGQSPPAEVPYGLRILQGLFVEGPGGWAEVLLKLVALVQSAPPKGLIELKKELADLEAEVAREEAGWTAERRAERRALTQRLREATEPTEVVKPGACFAGRYPIIDKLGQGAFASVWKAQDGRRTVALRIMHPHLGAPGRDRFFRGGRAMAALDHPHIVRVHEAEGDYQGQAFLTMELLAGGDLTVAQRAGRITRADTSRIISAVADALESAHQGGLIHRDVKPTNIVLTSDGVPKLTDFDLVHAADSYAGTHTAMVGSPCFMAPECDGKNEPTAAADQFGLAMTAVWLLVERDLKLEDWMRPERTLAKMGLPRGVTEVLLQALELDPRERHASVQGFAEALAEALRPPTARAPAPQESREAAQPEPVDGQAGPGGSASRRPAPSLHPAGGERGAEIERHRLGGSASRRPAPPLHPAGGERVGETPTLQQSGQVVVRPGAQAALPVRSSLPGLVLVPIPSGTFLMGSPEGVGDNDERPQHQVTLSAFLMGATTITQAQYQAVTGTNPAHFKGNDRPVERVSWEDAVDFCNALSHKEGLQAAYDGQRNPAPTADGYRLPTEAQWEYACRAGNPGRWCFGDDEKKLSEYAWFDQNAQNGTHPVGQKKANAWGLYDLHGNVWEWCEDQHGAYPSVPQTEPIGPGGGVVRVLRGGSCWNSAEYCRSARRGRLHPWGRSHVIGFRVLRRLTPSA